MAGRLNASLALLIRSVSGSLIAGVDGFEAALGISFISFE